MLSNGLRYGHRLMSLPGPGVSPPVGDDPQSERDHAADDPVNDPDGKPGDEPLRRTSHEADHSKEMRLRGPEEQARERRDVLGARFEVPTVAPTKTQKRPFGQDVERLSLCDAKGCVRNGTFKLRRRDLILPPVHGIADPAQWGRIPR